MKTINLKEILTESITTNFQKFGRSKEESDSAAKMLVESMSSQHIIEAMKEACKQTLQLASEEATIDYEGGVPGVDKLSILDIIKQVE